MLIDMHSHLSALSTSRRGKTPGDFQVEVEKEARKELEFRKKEGILSFFSGGSPMEWELLSRLGEEETFLKSFAIHPWYADKYEIGELRPYLDRCEALGEMGMDKVWCQVELPVQRRRFEDQLLLAADLHKPVILHTKGQEAVIASMLKDFPEKVCVHWYSGGERELEAFLEKGCFFTLGPDTASLCKGSLMELPVEKREEALLRRRMVREIPADRLFLETDGIEAVAWAFGEGELPMEALTGVLKDNLAFLAEGKGVPFHVMEGQLLENLRDFTGRAVNRGDVLKR